MPAPLIGLTVGRVQKPKQIWHLQTPEAYSRAISAAGGAPVLIPPGLAAADMRELRSRLDGLLLTGGGDLDPALFGGQPHPRVYDIDPQRDELEIELARLAARNCWPFLGICRGLQVLNVALGGSLFTHIADQLPNALRHDFLPDWPRDHLAHTVRLQANSRLEHTLGCAELQVNSLHHQGAEKIAPGLSATAHSPDGLVEALELPSHPFGLAVQWHPEELVSSQPMQALFKAFVKAAQAQNDSPR